MKVIRLIACAKPGRAAAFAALITVAAMVQAQSPGGGKPVAAPSAAQGSAPATLGEVRKIDKTQGTVTLKHGPIVNLDMSAMTMAFKASDPKLLNGLKVGDKVRFSAVDANGTLTVTAIESAK